MALGAVKRKRDPRGERARAFGVGAHGQEHAPHIGMDDDGIGRLVGEFLALERAALQPVHRVLPRRLVGGLAECQALQADAEPRRVHHREHGAHALMRLADEIALGRLEIDDAGGRCLDAHLVLDRAAAHAVARARGAVLLDLVFGHDEEADAVDARRRAGDARQHEMDDVVGEVVLAGGDEDLGAGNLVGAVAGRLRSGADLPEIGAALRLGQAHGAAPGAVDQARQEFPLLLGAAVAADGAIGAARQARIHAEGHVGRGHHLLDEEIERVRQPLPAVIGIGGERGPAALAEQRVGRLEALGRAHRAVLVGAALLVAAAVQREEHFLGDLGAFLEHRLEHVGRRLLVSRQLRQLADIEQFLQHEAIFAQRRLVEGHEVLRDTGAFPLALRDAPCGRSSGWGTQFVLTLRSPRSGRLEGRVGKAMGG